MLTIVLIIFVFIISIGVCAACFRDPFEGIPLGLALSLAVVIVMAGNIDHMVELQPVPEKSYTLSLVSMDRDSERFTLFIDQNGNYVYAVADHIYNEFPDVRSMGIDHVDIEITDDAPYVGVNKYAYKNRWIFPFHIPETKYVLYVPKNYELKAFIEQKDN